MYVRRILSNGFYLRGGFNYRIGIARLMARHTSQSSTISSYYLTVLVAFLMTAVIATPMASSELSGGEGDTSGRSAYWQQGTVSFNEDAGAANSIVVDDDGAMHIAHINPTNGELLYSTNSSSTSWTTTNFSFGTNSSNYELQDGVQGKTAIALDSEGVVNIAYRRPSSSNNSVYDLHHILEVPGNWMQVTVSTGRDMGHHLSMTIDSNDTAHIAYRDNTNGKLRYAFTTTCGWCWDDDAVVMSTGTEIPGGYHTSIATDSNNNPIIAQCNSHNGSLMLLQWIPSGGYWSMSYPDGQGNGCKHTSMEIYTPLTGGEEIHISYARDEDSDGISELRYATNKNGGWNGYTVDGSGLGSSIMRGMTSISVDSVGAVHIAYSGNYVDADADLKYALKPSTPGSSWSTEVASTENTYHVSIDVDSNDVPYISYLKSCGITCSELAYAKLIQTGGGASEIVNSNPYYNTTSDLLMGAWNASSLVGGTDYNATLQVYDYFNGQLLNTYTHTWTQSTVSTVYEYNPPSGNPELTEGDTYCVVVTLYDGSDGSQLAMDETCVTIPDSESISNLLHYDTGNQRLHANYSAAGLEDGVQYTVYQNLMDAENNTIEGENGSHMINPAGLTWSGSFGSWALEELWMSEGSTYCIQFEISHLGQSNYISSDYGCVTIPSGSGSSENITSYLNFDTTSQNLTADIDSTSLTLGESYEVQYFLWHTEDNGQDQLIDQGSENFTIEEIGNKEVWDEWALSSPENENGINRGETYCLEATLYNGGTQVATTGPGGSCVTIPTLGGGDGTDTDGDGIQDSNDICWDGNTGWTSNTSNDYDQDGCFDGTEDWDDDNDQIDDEEDSCFQGTTNWSSWQEDPVLDHDHDGCHDATEDDDDDDDGRTDVSDDCLLTRVGAIVDANGCETSFPDDDGDGVANSYDQCDDTPIGEEVGWYGCPFNQEVVDLIAILTQDDGQENGAGGARLLASYIVSNTEPDQDYQLDWYIDRVNGECAAVESRLDEGTIVVVGGAAISETPIEMYYASQSQWTPGGQYCLNLELFDEGDEQVALTATYLNSIIPSDDEDGCEEWEYWNPELVDPTLPGNGCPTYIDESIIEEDWWVEIPVFGVLIEQVQTEYGRYISMATVGLAILGWGYRAVTMRSDYKMEKRCRKFEKRIDRASSASELRSIQVEIEKAQKKGLILRGAYGDLLSRIEMRSEDLGLTDFITNDTLVQAGVSEMEFREGIEDLRAAKMELDMVRDDLERSRYEDSSSAQSKSAKNFSDKVTNEKLSGTGKAFVSRPSYHPKDINQDGVVDEEDERLWQSMSEAERQSRLNKDVHLVSEIVAFSKIPISPKARCKCGSRKQFAKCHMKKIKCPCGSDRKFIKCCAKKRGYN